MSNSVSKIEQTITEIEQYIERCKYQPFSNTKIIVERDELDELLRELRMKTPEEIKRYQKILNNKEAILADAQAKAEAMIAQATAQTNELVSEHEIMQQAYAQANEIVMLATKQAQEILDQAASEANEIRTGAMAYLDDMLGNLQSIIGHAMDTANAKYENLIHSLQGCYDIVNANKAELQSPEEEPVYATDQPTEDVPDEYKLDMNPEDFD